MHQYDPLPHVIGWGDINQPNISAVTIWVVLRLVRITVNF